MPDAQPVELRETEEQWQLRVAQFALYHGWRVAHFRTAGTARGWRTPAYTLDAYGHLIDGELGPALDLSTELRPAAARPPFTGERDRRALMP